MNKASFQLKTFLDNSKCPIKSYSQLDVLACFNNQNSVILKKLYFLAIFIVIVGVLNDYSNLLLNPKCLIAMPSGTAKAFREPETCDFCHSVIRVDKTKQIDERLLYLNYAKLGRPIIVKDGAMDWPAIDYFNYSFFKELYGRSDDLQNNMCQFFPYQTEFTSLADLFAMSDDRAQLKSGELPWYVGWSNCNNEVGRQLFEYLPKPYFISRYMENIALSWTFMGGPGQGANMHVDDVFYPSWQAQLKGTKLWRLAPPPECYYQCHQIEIDVRQGEILVLDTNKWYHQTFVQDNNISITIGSEFQ